MEPMQCELVPRLPDGPGWQYELKYDGYRALALKTKRGVELLSRRNNELNTRFPAVVRALEQLAPDTMLDGEVIALDAKGRPAFTLLHKRDTSPGKIFYVAFDILAYRGKNLVGLPLDGRRTLLERALDAVPDPIRLSPRLHARATELIKAATDQGLEGLIGKRLDSVYEPGRRSGAWVKQRVSPGQELVVGGYVPGAQYFDALLVGYYEGDRLLFVGKIRNGFVPAVKAQLFARFKALETRVCPFANLPEAKNARRGIALTAETMKECRWLEPELVAQIEFTEWTDKNHLRHARFLGLRDDKDPQQVTREAADA
jgi:DNA ligase D-like protein (predicted ligase)